MISNIIYTTLFALQKYQPVPYTYHAELQPADIIAILCGWQIILRDNYGNRFRSFI